MNNKPYKLYTDKAQDFECQLYLEGIPMENTKARMVIESEDASISFGGTINKQGKCIIPISALGNRLGKIDGGLMRLEVFAGDIFFQPWKSSFVIRGREFDASINSVQDNFELSIMKEDIKQLSEKVSYLTKTESERYDLSLEKWSVTNEDSFVNEKNKDKISPLNELNNRTLTKKEENYKGIVDKWGAINDEDFEI